MHGLGLISFSLVNHGEWETVYAVQKLLAYPGRLTRKYPLSAAASVIIKDGEAAPLYLLPTTLTIYRLSL